MTSAAFYTERAILGAILADPAQLAILHAAGLQDGDFGHAAHRDIYRVLDQLNAEGWTTRRIASFDDDSTEVEVAFYGAVLQGMRAISSGYTSDAFGHDYLFGLYQESARPHNAVAYVPFLIEERLKHTVLAAAARTAEIITSGPDDDLDDLLRVTTHTVAAARQIVGTLAARWGLPLPLTGAEPTDAAVELPEAISSHTVQTIITAAERRHDPAEAADHETRILTGLLARPSQLTEISGWLHPDDFQHPHRRVLYTAMLAVHEAGQPLDPITLMWHLHRTGHLDDTLTPETLLRLAEEPAHPADPHNAALNVLATAIRIRLTAHARDLAGVSQQPSTNAEYLTSINTLISALRTEHHRWRSVHSQLDAPDVETNSVEIDAVDISLQ